MERTQEVCSGIRLFDAGPRLRGDTVSHQCGVLPAASLPVCLHHLQVSGTSGRTDQPQQMNHDTCTSCLQGLQVSDPGHPEV